MRTLTSRSLSIALTALAIGLTYGASDATAQRFRWPENPENTQVLPDSITGAKLGMVMRGFTFALGVRCSTCHMGEEGQNLTEYDFPADDREMKRIARVMIEMVQRINGEHLSPVDTIRAEASSRVTVTCTTCHRGVRKPRMLEDVMGEELDAGGLASADSTYRALREEYYGGFSYDFLPGPLRTLGERLAAEGRVDEAVSILELEAEFNPESYFTYATLAGIQARAGQTEAAIANMEKAIEFAPDRFKGFLQQQLERMKSSDN